MILINGHTFNTVPAEVNLMTFGSVVSAIPPWENNNMVITENAATDDEGNLLADKIVPTTASSNNHCVARYDLQVVAGKSYELSFYYKPAGYVYATLELFSDNFSATYVYTVFNLSTQIIEGGASGTITMTPKSNGYYKVTASFTASVSSSTTRLYISALPTSEDGQFSGNGTDGIYLTKGKFLELS
jgi:hypothetical protein